MSTQGSTAKYIEVSCDAYGLIVDVLASASRARLAYWKSIWELASRPYASTALEPAVRESFERASELTNLTVDELRARGKRTAEFSEKFLGEVEKLQDAGVEVFRDSLKAFVSSVEQVKDATADLSINGKSAEKPVNLVAASN
ncbi:MAG: hypothetical protein ACLPYS_21250 [Vulcanimicrobiaceae bacterium]